MVKQRIIGKTLICRGVTVTTVELIEDHELVGLHAVLKTFVVGVEDIDSKKPYVAYNNQTSADIGHQQIVVDIRRKIVEQRFLAEGFSPTLIEGVL